VLVSGGTPPPEKKSCYLKAKERVREKEHFEIISVFVSAAAAVAVT
jgi:hypothetical protein